MLEFNVPFVLLSDLVFTLLLLAITYWRLYPVLRYFRVQPPHVAKSIVFDRLMRFPLELFWGMVLLSIVFIVLYHGSEIMMGSRALASIDNAARLLNSVLSELSLSLILAILLFSITRHLLRSYAVRLEIHSIVREKPYSAVSLIAMSAVVCFVITFSAASRVIVRSNPDELFLRLVTFLLIAGVYAAFAIGIVSLYMVELRKELRMLIDGLHALSGGMKTTLHQKLTIISLDETGRLADAFNALQHWVERTYDEVDRQLKLAYKVQQRLLPTSFPVMEGVDIAASCQQCQEVGGDFYDVIPLGERYYCVAIGDVTGKGLPAALLVSAMMTGLRTEAAKGGTAGDIITRLNRHVFHMTQGKMFTTLGLALIDLSSGTARLEYASAGHLDPYIFRNGQVMELQCSSLPLGISPDTVYQGILNTLAPGDIFILYTDGIIESRHASGGMLGFEWWEQELRQLSPYRGLEEQLLRLIKRPQHEEAEELGDDRTLVMVRWNGYTSV